MRILLAEDDQVSRTKLERVLTKWEYDVIAVEDGERALEILQRPNGPRLALLDWLMPGVDGVNVCRQIRAIEGHPYVYMMLLTQKNAQQDIVAGLKAGADDYLVKPVNPGELFGRLQAGRRVLRAQEQLLRMREELTRQALYDPLTETLNRRGGFLGMRREMERAARHGTPTTVVLCDLDRFKDVNDTYGHPAGDEVLRVVCARMASVIRPYDILCRYGGEEFLILLPDCEERDAVAIVERCREKLEREPVETDAGSVALTASFGCCSSPWREGLLAEDMIAAADAALYRAKRAGRNRVEVALPPAPQADTEI
jgi:diguanylate cyclase (GGDEF)-like protein